MKELMVGSEAQVVEAKTFSHLIESFLSSQDIKQTSKGTYEKGLKRFMLWIEEKGITKTHQGRYISLQRLP